ncbi:HAD family hydrolase [Metabacillus fastidiosus]|uniref:HAD family hydrolase n=1 Tax=Metabacillus fastidiosus TaxID=1458 RepID=UPI002E1D225A|nr:HAD family hydrolase [Metabacillus fastidiosus]
MTTNFKLLFLDIDGTTLRPDDTIENSTKEAVAAVQEKGVGVFLATGRPLHEISDIAKELNIDSFIGYNGAFALHNKKEIINAPMNEQAVQFFIKTAKELGHEIVMYTEEKNVFTTLETEKIKQFIQTFHLRKNELYNPEVTSHILGMTLMNIKETELKQYENAYNIHLSQVNVEGMRDCYDVIRDSVNKGSAIQAVLKHLNVEKQSSIAFGDGMNDKEMLTNVGESFAMGNAHPDLFAYAKHKTTSVTNSGIYNGLKLLGLLS